jgi:hypothetical protein
VDWNNDGKKDLIAGDTAGNVTLFLNVGTKEKPELAKGKPVEADGKPIVRGSHKLAQTYAWIHMADWTGDGLKDLFVGHSSIIAFYKNIGSESSPRFAAPTQLPAPEGGFPTRPSAYVVDWDGDGKKDLLMGGDPAEIRFYRNIGTNAEPRLAKAEVLELKIPGDNPGYRWRLELTDWNNDGKLDILVGNAYSRRTATTRGTGGNIYLFLRK